MDMSHGDALTILKCRTSSMKNKLKALNVIFTAEPKFVYSRLTKNDLWLMAKSLYEELLNGYEDVVITKENPCYHCYLGSINKCRECDIHREEWAGQLESPYYTKAIKFREISNKILE